MFLKKKKIKLKKSKLDNLKKRKILNCKPEDVIKNNWEREWTVNYKYIKSYT
jgi:hypothetical protein